MIPIFEAIFDLPTQIQIFFLDSWMGHSCENDMFKQNYCKDMLGNSKKVTLLLKRGDSSGTIAPLNFRSSNKLIGFSPLMFIRVPPGRIQFSISNMI